MLGEAESAKLAWKPATEVEVRGDDAASLMKLIDALDEDDDVQTVWGNYDVPDEELERLRLIILGLDPGPRHDRLGADPRPTATASPTSPTAS